MANTDLSKILAVIDSSTESTVNGQANKILKKLSGLDEEFDINTGGNQPTLNPPILSYSSGNTVISWSNPSTNGNFPVTLTADKDGSTPISGTSYTVQENDDFTLNVYASNPNFITASVSRRIKWQPIPTEKFYYGPSEMSDFSDGDCCYCLCFEEESYVYNPDLKGYAYVGNEWVDLARTAEVIPSDYKVYCIASVVNGVLHQAPVALKCAKVHTWTANSYILNFTLFRVNSDNYSKLGTVDYLSNFIGSLQRITKSSTSGYYRVKNYVYSTIIQTLPSGWTFGNASTSGTPRYTVTQPSDLVEFNVAGAITFLPYNG